MAAAVPAFAGGVLSLRAPAAARAAARPRARRLKSGPYRRLFALLSGSGATFCFVAALFLSTGVYGAFKGGHYDALVAAEGEPADILARALGFSIKAVTIAGQGELSEAEILAVARIGPRNSLPFLDVAAVRERLRKLPLVKDVAVTKFFPDRLLIEVEERQPAALWQSDGAVHVVASDGMAIDDMRDRRFMNLPLVVGDGANARLAEYLALLAAAGDLAERIRAGVFVSGRRWNFKMADGVDVLLPESNPAAAVASLVRLQREAHILDKALLSIDLRQPGRMVARLTEDAAAARAEVGARKPKPKGGQT
jgi:cell division protein FtsQ